MIGMADVTFISSSDSVKRATEFFLNVFTEFSVHGAIAIVIFFTAIVWE